MVGKYVDMLTVLQKEGFGIRRLGNRYFTECPFHDDKNPSLAVHERTRGRFFCFGCQAQGTAVDFIMRYKGVDHEEAVRYLKLEYHIIEKIASEPTMIEIIAEEERNGVDVKSKYGDFLINQLLRQELYSCLKSGKESSKRSALK